MRKATALDRFWAKTDRTGTCWIWQGAQVWSRSAAYGSFWFDGRMWRAHRWVVDYLRGSVSPDMRVDHLCRNTLCVRPDHLEVVTNRENIIRGTSPVATNAAKTHCIRGHVLDPANVYTSGPDGRWRTCKACRSTLN